MDTIQLITPISASSLVFTQLKKVNALVLPINQLILLKMLRWVIVVKRLGSMVRLKVKISMKEFAPISSI